MKPTPRNIIIKLLKVPTKKKKKTSHIQRISVRSGADYSPEKTWELESIELV